MEKNILLWIILSAGVFIAILLGFLYSTQKVDFQYDFISLIEFGKVSGQWNGNSLNFASFSVGNLILVNSGTFEKVVTLPSVIGCIKKLNSDGSEGYFKDKLYISFFEISDESWKSLSYFPYSSNKISIGGNSNISLNAVAFYDPTVGNDEFYTNSIVSVVFYENPTKEDNPFDFDYSLENSNYLTCDEISRSLNKIAEIKTN